MLRKLHWQIRQLVQYFPQADLTDGGGHIFGSASEPGCVVCEDQVIVNGLGNADETDAAFVGSRAARESLLTVSMESFPPMYKK